MYAHNETNALYFFPHRISFEPRPVADDIEQHRHWSLRHLVSTPPLRARPSSAPAPATPNADPSDRRETDPRPEEADRMDDDGAPPLESEPGET